jgi:UV radiation resistance-associated gene protein
VATIFPIEPIEPRDLLFGILNTPLPIPTGTNDPAPPLTITSDSSYSEDTMASALGFVAQAVNLVAAYLGDAPVYPIVCQGSRSLIKDPISAMMGPRMYA